MGWEPLPFSCLGLVRRTGDVKGDNIWAWIILVPWSSEGKPWIDGSEMIQPSMNNPFSRLAESTTSRLGFTGL